LQLISPNVYCTSDNDKVTFIGYTYTQNLFLVCYSLILNTFKIILISFHYTTPHPNLQTSTQKPAPKTVPILDRSVYWNT